MSVPRNSPCNGQAVGCTCHSGCRQDTIRTTLGGPRAARCHQSWAMYCGRDRNGPVAQMDV
eukprot:11213104-Lingulodinium_polyedra.AAC.1